MTQIEGSSIADVTSAGAADDGNIVHLTLVDPNGAKVTILMSYKTVPKLIAALLTGGELAAKERIKRFGSKAAADTALGIQSINIQGFSVGVGQKSDTGEIDVILHLETATKLSFDMALPCELARQLGEALTSTADQGPGLLKRQKRH